jgi:DNA-binding IclR family transcriptional regulator
MTHSTEVRQKVAGFGPAHDRPIPYALTAAGAVYLAPTPRSRYDALVAAIADSFAALNPAAQTRPALATRAAEGRRLAVVS